MNNLILATTLIATAGMLLIVEGRVGYHLESGNRSRRAQLRNLERESDGWLAVITEARFRLGQQRSDLADTRASLPPVSEPAKAPPLDPGQEGLWPREKSYCYVAKAALKEAFFQKFQPAPKGIALHADTALVLGLTPEEAVTVDQGFQALVGRFQELELERLEPSAAHLPAGGWHGGGEKISYRIPALRSEMEGPMASYFTDMRALLGDSRAELFEYWAREGIAESLGDFAPKARTITFTEERQSGEHQMTRFQIAEEGGKELYYYELWNKSPEIRPDYALPAEFAPRFPYRHLFGDNGERRRNPRP